VPRLTGLAGLVLALPVLGGCARADAHAEARALIAANCASCHRVPGVPSATGRVGPSLEGLAREQVLAGRLANTPANLHRWIAHPQAVDPGVDMPEMGLTDAQVDRIVAYLYTLD
jgi:cytochrome c1